MRPAAVVGWSRVGLQRAQFEKGDIRLEQPLSLSEEVRVCRRLLPWDVATFKKDRLRIIMEVEHHGPGPAGLWLGDHFCERSCHERPFRMWRGDQGWCSPSVPAAAGRGTPLWGEAAERGRTAGQVRTCESLLRRISSRARESVARAC